MNMIIFLDLMVILFLLQLFNKMSLAKPQICAFIQHEDKEYCKRQSQNQTYKLKLVGQVQTFIKKVTIQKKYIKIIQILEQIQSKTDCLVFALKRILAFINVSRTLYSLQTREQLIKYLIAFQKSISLEKDAKKCVIEGQEINKYIIQVFKNNRIQCNCCSNHINITNIDANDQIMGIETITQNKYPQFQLNQRYLKNTAYTKINQGGGLILIAKVASRQEKKHNYQKIIPFTSEQAEANKKNVENSFLKIIQVFGLQKDVDKHQMVKIDIVKQKGIRELQNFKNFSNKRKYFIRVKLLNSKQYHQRLFWLFNQKKNSYQLLMKNQKGQSFKLNRQYIYQFIQGFYKSVVKNQEYFDCGVYNKNHINTELREYIIKYSSRFYKKEQQQIENALPQLKYNYCYILRLTSHKNFGLLKQFKKLLKQIEEDCVISVPFQQFKFKCPDKIVFISVKNQINSYASELQSKIPGLKFDKLNLQRVQKRIDITFNYKNILPLKQIKNLQRILRKQGLCNRIDLLRTQSGCQIQFSNQISSIFALIYIHELSYPVKFIPVRCYQSESTSSKSSTFEDDDQ